MTQVRFASADLPQPLPVPGYYLAAVVSARWRRSAAGNRMAHVAFALDDVPEAHERVSDYFALEGVTPRGLALARTRLVELFQACGRTPRAGEEIALEDLPGQLLEVKLDHELWKGRPKLRVIGYRRVPALADADRSQELDGQGFLFPTGTDSTGGAHA